MAGWASVTDLDKKVRSRDNTHGYIKKGVPKEVVRVLKVTERAAEELKKMIAARKG